jgi:hypothetical protein
VSVEKLLQYDQFITRLVLQQGCHMDNHFLI